MKNAFYFALAIVLSACSNNSTTAPKKITIGFSQCTTQDDWRRNMIQEMKREIGFHNNYDIELVITDAGDNSERQVKQVTDLLSAGIDILIISPNEAEPLTEIVEKVYDSGIPVIVIDRRINSDKFTAYIGGDNFVIGKEAASFANQLLNGKGRILEITGLARSTPAVERAGGFAEGIKEFPGLKVTKVIRGDWLKERAQGITDTLLSYWSDFDLIFAHNDQMAYGASLSAKKHGLKPYIIGVDGLHTPDDGVDMVVNGSIDGTFLYPTGGDKALELALNVLEGKRFEKFNFLQTSKIDHNNARVFKLQAAQLMDQAQRIDMQRREIGEMIFLIKKKDTLSILFAISSALLLSLVGMCIYFIHHKNKINHALDLKKKTIQDQNRQITEQRDKLIRTLRVAEEATEAKIRFFINVSHEIKTVLSVISIPDNENAAEGLMLGNNARSLRKSVSRLLALSEEIVNFKQSGYHLKISNSNLAACLNGIVKVFEETAIEKGIILISEFPPKLNATFDPSVIEKIMFNLLSNAIKYTQRGGEVKVRASVTLEKIEIVVSDNGVGIPEEELPFIFERFYRGRTVRQNNNELGSGVGLDFTRELIQLHGGDIKVVSQVNRGSVFTIALPQNKPLSGNDHEVNEPATSAEEHKLVPSGRKIKVLVVEDTEELRDYMAILLSKYFSVITAANGVDALAKAKSIHPDIIVSDILMPEKDGIELCFDLKNDPATFLIPVILLTAMDSETSLIKSFETGADAYLSKPVNEKLLITRINNLIDSRKKLKDEYGKPFLALADLKSKDKQDEEFVKNCLEEIYKGISDPNFNLIHLSRRVGMSRSSLYRKIKEVTGLKAVDFLRKAKLQYASRLLLNSDLNIGEIAWESGFSDVKYFSKVFAKEFGQLPSKFHAQG
ncbi:MAG: substrate-binding domain-containing protein [Chitinophagaceae bacterium]|nr:substrate-binding domain-containing protein [Chitinophagaceae bacterium]